MKSSWIIYYITFNFHHLYSKVGAFTTKRKHVYCIRIGAYYMKTRQVFLVQFFVTQRIFKAKPVAFKKKEKKHPTQLALSANSILVEESIGILFFLLYSLYTYDYCSFFPSPEKTTMSDKTASYGLRLLDAVPKPAWFERSVQVEDKNSNLYEILMKWIKQQKTKLNDWLV